MVSNTMIYPWLQPYWQQLLNNQQQQRLPHALLFVGAQGLGKTAFSRYLAKGILCLTKGITPCGQCRSCHWFEQNTHADYLHLTTDKATIGIDSIREGILFLQQGAKQSPYQVITLPEAEKMTIAAENALLKILEEPLVGSYIILTTQQTSQLKPTTLSRCQQLYLTITHQETVSLWLAQQGLPPISASIITLLSQQLFQQPLLLLKQLQTLDLDEFQQVIIDYQNWFLTPNKIDSIYHWCKIHPFYLQFFNSYLQQYINQQNNLPPQRLWALQQLWLNLQKSNDNRNQDLWLSHCLLALRQQLLIIKGIYNAAN